MEISTRYKRPSASIESIATYNTFDKENCWIPTNVERGSWIIMQHARRKTQTTKNQFISCWKSRVKDFRLGTNKKAIKEVLVQHVYMHKELHIDPTSFDLPLYRPKCKSSNFLSFFLLCFEVADYLDFLLWILQIYIPQM